MCLSTAGKVASVEERGGVTFASVTFDDRPVQVCISYVPDLRPDDYVLVAGGAVLERVDEDEALLRASFADILLHAFDDCATAEKGANQA